jgi:hypothetical protein
LATGKRIKSALEVPSHHPGVTAARRSAGNLNSVNGSWPMRFRRAERVLGAPTSVQMLKALPRDAYALLKQHNDGNRPATPENASNLDYPKFRNWIFEKQKGTADKRGSTQMFSFGIDAPQVKIGWERKRQSDHPSAPFSAFICIHPRFSGLMA